LQWRRALGAVRYNGENLVNYRYQFRYESDKLAKESQISCARLEEEQLTVYQYSYDDRGNLVRIATAGTNDTNEETPSAPATLPTAPTTTTKTRRMPTATSACRA
jgi:YD repeat-containing protein